MSQELYDHPWVEAYRQKKDNLSFWEFIDLVRMYNLSTLGPYLVQAYKLYVSDYPKEMLPRLTPEIRQFIEDGAGPLTFGDHSGYNASRTPEKCRLADATPRHRAFSVQRILDSRNAETPDFAYTRRRSSQHAQPIRESPQSLL